MFEVAVIGGGPGGYRAAQLLADKGHTVALVEKDELGGVCLNCGCIPFKTYLHIAGIAHDSCVNNQEGIFKYGEVELNQKALLDKKEKTIKGLRQGIKGGLLSKGVTLISGEAFFSGKKGDSYLFDVNGETIECNKVILAMGSIEVKLFGIDKSLTGPRIITSKEMLELHDIPRSITIIGGGAIGLEAACYFNEAGSMVSVIEATSHIGGKIDLDIANALEKILHRKSINIITNAAFKKVVDGGVSVENADDTTETISSDYVLISVGRKPNIRSKFLSDLNIDFDSFGIKIDDKCKTTDPNIFACGDITGKLMLAHTAYYQAKVIADTIDDIENSVDYNKIPRIIYSNPEVLSVGFTEQECIDSGINYQSRSLPMTYSGKYFADYGKDGAKAKLIVDDRQQIIGFHMIGNNSSELSLAAEMMIVQKMNVKDLCNLVYAHPTYSEIIGDLAESFSNAAF